MKSLRIPSFFIIVLCALHMAFLHTAVNKNIDGGITLKTEIDEQNKSHSAVIGNPLQTISDYQLFIMKNLTGVKETLDHVTNKITKNQQNNSGAHSTYQDEIKEKKLELLHIFQEILLNVERVKDEITELIDEYQSLIDHYFSDTLFEKRTKKVPRKTSYENIKDYTKTITKLEEAIEKITKNLEETIKEKHNREILLKNTTEIIVVKEEPRNKKKYRNGQESCFSLIKESDELATSINEYKQLLSHARLRKTELEQRVLETKKSILKEELRSNQENYKKIRSRLVIEDNYLNDLAEQEKYIQKGLLEKKETLLSSLHFTNIQLNAADESLAKISGYKTSKDALDALIQSVYPINILALSSLIYSIDLLVKSYFIQAQLEYIQTQIKYSQKNVDIARSWALSLKRGTHEKNIKQAISFLEIEAIQAEVEELLNEQAQIATFLQKKTGLQSALRESLIYLMNANDVNDNKKIKELLGYVEISAQEQHGMLISTNEMYTRNIALLRELELQAHQVVTELKSKSFWARSQNSIGMAQLETFFPDNIRFVRIITAGFLPFVKQCYEVITFKKTLPLLSYIYFSALLILSIAIGALGYAYIPQLQRYFSTLASQVPYAARANLFINFITEEGPLLYCWLVAFIFFKCKAIPFSYAALLFYLLSIPYLIIVFIRFFRWFDQINAKKGYIFIVSEYSNRFIYIISGLACATVIIYFYREAFLKSGLVYSQVPTILLAAHFIILQISLIFLLRKEQLLHFISDENDSWKWFKNFLDEYYNIFLVGIVAIIIMSNPYVGYGSQVLYVVTRLAITALIVPFFSKIHDFIKQRATDIFFYQTEQDTIQNRIPGGKAWYAFFVLILFIAITVACYIFVWRIWGVQINLETLRNYLEFNILSSHLAHSTDHVFSLTILDIGKIFLFVVGGYITTYILNTFILKRIFTPLMVGPGIKNTVTTITRYVIVTLAFLLGLYSVGLENLIIKIFVTLGLIGFAIKEPIADLISYFILLIQRPIKIGDLIRITTAPGEPEIIGLVRQITPRATLVRQRNSQTVIIPNSLLITRSVTNWNFTRGFIATEDIILTVGFMHDPESVKAILYKSIESHPAILKNPAPIVWCNNFTPSGYQFLVRGFIASDRSADHWEISSQIRIILVKKLRLSDITISAPYTLVEIIKQKEKTQLITENDLHELE